MQPDASNFIRIAEALIVDAGRLFNQKQLKMKGIDIIQQIKLGEVSKVQFKERLLDNYEIGCELVAFSNARGGILVVGVKDKTGSINPFGTGLDADSDTFNADSDTKIEHSYVDSDTDLGTCGINLDTNSDTKRPKITNKQRDVINFCSVPRSSKEILERAGVTYHSKNIQTYIMSLVEAGYLEMTNPEHPNASNQKYRRRKK